MTITYDGQQATYTEGVWASDNPDFTYWLQTAFPAPTADDLIAHGLEVAGAPAPVAPPAE